MVNEGVLPTPIPSDFPGGQLLWNALEGHRDRLQHILRSKGAELGIDEALTSSLGSLVGAAVQRHALCDGDWEAYAETLRTKARECAASRVPLHTWFDLLDASDAALQDLLQPQKRELEAASVLRAFTMARFGGEYVQAAARLDDREEPDSTLFQLLFANNLSGTLIYRFPDRSDLASFRLVCANVAAAHSSHPRIFEHVGKSLGETSPYLLETPIPHHYANAVLFGKSASWVISTGSEALAKKTYAARCFQLDGDHVAVSFEDITERQEMQRRIEHHIAELERSNHELDEFAYVASHDLKGPLQDVKTLATWIQEDLGEELPKNTVRHLQTMVDRVCRMERLLDDLLTYSRAGRVDAPGDAFEVRELFNEVLAVTSIPDGFTIEVAADIAPIRTPKAPLAQVVRNLVGNAIKHHDRPSGAVRLAAHNDGERIRIVVSDDGPGIPPEFHGRVFRIFQTLRPRDDLEGSGIGLAIVKKVVESHGGTVGLYSVGRGTAISFTWPKECLR